MPRGRKTGAELQSSEDPELEPDLRGPEPMVQSRYCWLELLPQSLGGAACCCASSWSMRRFRASICASLTFDEDEDDEEDDFGWDAAAGAAGAAGAAYLRTPP